MKRSSLLVFALTLVPLLAEAQSQDTAAQPRSFGAFLAPAVLPAGSASTYGFVGVPAMGAGYRQGLGGSTELEARLEIDYFALSLTPLVGLKVAAYQDVDGPFYLAPRLSVGLVLNSGAEYIDTENFAYVGLRLDPGMVLSYQVAETASLVGDLRVPIDFSMSPGGGRRVSPLLGGGAELFLGENVTAGILGQLGVDVIKEPLGVARVRLGYGLRVGFGWRLF
jgi:hypothetical protein